MASALIKLREVTRRTALGRSTIYAKMNAGQFPSSVKLGDRSVAWVEAEVEEWVESRILEARSPSRDKTLSALRPTRP